MNERNLFFSNEFITKQNRNEKDHSIPLHWTFLMYRTLIYRGSYRSAHVLLNLLNELGKEIKCEACRAFYLFRNEFNKINNTRARM